MVKKKSLDDKVPPIEVLTKEQRELLEKVSRAYATYYIQKCEGVK